MPVFVCPECGRDEWTAWYPVDEGQHVSVGVGEDGEPIVLDYLGVTQTADISGEDDEIRCRNCDYAVRLGPEPLSLAEAVDACLVLSEIRTELDDPAGVSWTLDAAGTARRVAACDLLIGLLEGRRAWTGSVTESDLSGTA